MMIGTHTDSERSRRQTSKPSTSGSMTSRMTASNPPAAAASSASDPDAARSVTIALGLQAAAHGGCHARIVLDEQDSHGPSIPRRTWRGW